MASRFEELATNGKTRNAAIEYRYSLHKPWGLFSDMVRAALTRQVHRDLELGVSARARLRKICRDHRRN